MAVTRKTLKNNTRLGNNISRMQDMFSGLRALVLSGPLDGLEAIQVKDFYHLVILETDAALNSVPIPDYLVLSDASPYRNSVLFIDKFFGDTNTIYVLNNELIRTYIKLKRLLDLFDIIYLPAGPGTASTSPVQISLTPSGLDAAEPGVHLALILGCTNIHYTGTSAHATRVTLDDIKSFIQEADPNQSFIPRNFIATNRETVLNTSF